MLCSIHRIPESFGRDRVLLKMFDETDEEAEKVWDTGSDMSWLRSSSLLKNWWIGKNSLSYQVSFGAFYMYATLLFCTSPGGTRQDSNNAEFSTNLNEGYTLVEVHWEPALIIFWPEKKTSQSISYLKIEPF